MGEQAKKIYALLLEQLRKYHKLSTREKSLVFFMLAVVLLVIVYHGGSLIFKVFEEQSLTLQEVERERKNLPSRLERLALLKSRKEAIEQAYHQVEISEGAKSHLESLILGKESIFKDCFTIDDKEAKLFGGNFEQTAFKLRFRISNFAELVDLLKDLAKGEKPVLLKRISIRKSIRGDRLDVELDVTSISHIKT